MRAYYSTHKHVRIFVLGTPEGWHVGVFDLLKQNWAFDVAVQPSLKDAKIAAQQKAASVAGSREFPVSMREVSRVALLR